MEAITFVVMLACFIAGFLIGYFFCAFLISTFKEQNVELWFSKHINKKSILKRRKKKEEKHINKFKKKKEKELQMNKEISSENKEESRLGKIAKKKNYLDFVSEDENANKEFTKINRPKQTNAYNFAKNKKIGE